MKAFSYLLILLSLIIFSCKNATEPKDCAGVVNGTATLDSCAVCVGGTTSLIACNQDCAGDWGGAAVLDSCATCVGGTTSLIACNQDCAGDWDGTAIEDNCGICDSDNTNDCSYDCSADEEQCMENLGNWKDGYCWGGQAAALWLCFNYNETELWGGENDFFSEGEIPSEVFKLTNLKILYLSNNSFTTIPQDIGNLLHLEELYLNENQLSSLPGSISNLTKLRTLKLNENQLSSLPEGIGNLTALTNLTLDNNQLTSLPDSISNLSELEYFTLANNNIFSLPDSIGNMDNLNHLDITNNMLTSLPASIEKLEKLEILFVGQNQLTKMPSIDYGNMYSLKQFYLYDNEISSIPMPYLSDGSINTLSACELPQNDTYVRIELQDNKLCNEYSLNVHAHAWTATCPDGQTTQQFQIFWGNPPIQDQSNCCPFYTFEGDTIDHWYDNAQFGNICP